MSFSIALQVDQERIEQSDAAYCQWADWGAEDAASGEKPCFNNEAYRLGYTQETNARIDRNLCSTSDFSVDDEF